MSTEPDAVRPEEAPPTPRRGRRRLAAALAAAVAAGSGGAYAAGAFNSSSATSTRITGSEVTRADVVHLIDARSRAVREHDETSFMATVDPTNEPLVAQQRLEFANLVKLPIANYRLFLQQTFPPNNVSGTWVPGTAVVREESQIRGVDTTAIGDDEINYDLTVHREHLVISGDNSNEPWARTPLDVQTSQHFVVAVDHRIGDQLSTLVAACEQSLADDMHYFAHGWLTHYVLFATSDPKLFDSEWLTGSEGTDFVGYVTSFPQLARGGTLDLERQSPRIVIDYARTGGDPFALRTTLRHELTHAASLPVVQPATPTWILEGYADDVGYQGLPVQGTQGVIDALRPLLAHNPTLAFPPDGEAFYQGNVDQHYFVAFLAFRFIEERFGVDAAKRFYVTAQGGGSHLANAFKQLGLPLQTFQQQWSAWARHIVNS